MYFWNRTLHVSDRFSVHHQESTGCPTRYRTRHFFNNSNTNEDIATKFEQEYVRCVRNEKECVCSVCLFRCNIFIGVKIIKEMLGSVASGTTCSTVYTAIDICHRGYADYPLAGTE